MKILRLIFLFPILVPMTHAENDFVSSWTTSEDSPTRFVLRVPRKDQESSFWIPSKGPIPITPENAIELVFGTESINNDKANWKLIQITLHANSPLLSSTSRVGPEPPEGALITHYSVAVSSQQSGMNLHFMVLMDGRVFQSRLEEKSKPGSGFRE